MLRSACTISGFTRKSIMVLIPNFFKACIPAGVGAAPRYSKDLPGEN